MNVDNKGWYSVNVIVSNRQKEIIDNANIDAIKDLNGLFNVDDLINKFKNYFFSKMILDATSVVNFASKDVLRKLVDEIGAEKLIILLPSKPEPPTEFKKLLIDLQIFNFTNSIDDVVKFIEKPNTYEDAIKTIEGSFNNDLYVDNSIKEGEDTNQDESSGEEKSISSFNQLENESQSSLHNMLSNFSINDAGNVEVPKEKSEEKDDGSVKEISETYEEEKPDYDYNLNYNENEESDSSISDTPTNGNTFLISDSIDENNDYTEEVKEKKVIGIRNVTLNAGSTSLIYMLHKMASTELKKSTLSVEVDKKDFKFYRDSSMISVEKDKVKDIVNSSREELIFVDLNDCDDDSFCTDVIYLVEPSVIKLNKLMIENKNIFKELKDKKVILNKSLLKENDIRTLASEANMDFFYNIEPLNDRVSNDSIKKLLELLNIN